MPWWVHLIAMFLMFVPYVNVVVLVLYFLYYGIKIIVWDIKLILNLSILLFLLPFWLFLWLPYLFLRFILLRAGIKLGKFSFTWGEVIANNIQNTIQVIELKGKRVAQAAVLWGLILFIMFPIDSSTITGNIRPLLNLIILTIIPIGISAWIYSKLNSGELQETAQRTGRAAQEVGQRAAADPMQNQAKRTAGTVKEGAEGVRNEYQEINANVGEKAQGITENLFPSWFGEPLGNLISLTPLINMGAKEAGLKAGSKAAGAAENTKYSKYASKGTKGAKLIAGVSKVKLLIFLPFMLLFAGLILAVQLSFISGLFWAYMSIWMTHVVGPAWSAIGMAGMVAGDYGHAADQTIVDNYAPDIDLEDERMMLSEVGGRLDCLMSVDSVACMSEWRMNNTVQPGSEEVGQTYELQTNQFIVEGGRTIDVSGRRADLPISVRMALSNPRYGLRGVPAENVSYRIGITDRRKDGYYCDTGNHNLWEHDETGIDDNDLAPGDQYQLTSVQRSKDFYQDNINLGSCGLLQPGQIEETRQAELEINYTYTSQATQTFQAMSEEHRFDNEITQTFQTSETADTPVKSFVTVMSPVTYREDEDGTANSNVIDVEVGFETDNPGIDYQINTSELFLRPSRLTVPTGTEDIDDIEVPERDIETIEGQCDFRVAEDELGYALELNENATESIEAQQDPEDDEVEERWWTARSSPPTFQCSFELLDPGSISATGETLIKDVEGSYRVREQFTSQNFDAWNTECTDRNCPLVVPEDQRQQLIEESDDTATQNIGEGLVSKCDRSHSAEASGGCDVRPIPTTNDGEFDAGGWRVISQQHDDAQPGETIEHETLREGETAWTLGGLRNHLEDDEEGLAGANYETCEDEECGITYDEMPENWRAVGIDEENLDEVEEIMEDNDGGAALIRQGQGLDLEPHPYQKCSELEDNEFSDTDFVEAYTSHSFNSPVYMLFKDRGDCTSDWDDFIDEEFDGLNADSAQLYECTAGAVADGYRNIGNALLSVATFGNLGGDYQARCSESILEEAQQFFAEVDDFGEDAVWVYNVDEGHIEPLD